VGSLSSAAVLYAHYAKPIHRIVRWYNWRDRRSSEDKFAQRVVNEFGVDAIIAYGDSSGWHALPGLAPSPTTGLRKRLRAKQHQGLQVVDVPEAFTTLTCSSCGGRTAPDLTRATRKRQDGTLISPRGIRRCNSEQCGGLRWNRDHNAAINIRTNLLYRMAHGRFDPRFARHANDEPTPAPTITPLESGIGIAIPCTTLMSPHGSDL
jgi:hypothetical protein